MALADHIREVEDRIAAACAKSGRARSDVQLIAVSKLHPVQTVQEALASGLTVFGENRVQELQEKAAALSGEVLTWHLIGTLQSNKVKYLPSIPNLTMIQSVNSVKLLEEIERRFVDPVDILLEINVAGEDSKTGAGKEEAYALARAAASCSKCRVRGLMTVAPFTVEAQSNRVYFQALRELRDEINAQGILPEAMTELSMGMTGDYEVAIEEGATFVRVGTGIFGARDYG